MAEQVRKDIADAKVIPGGKGIKSSPFSPVDRRHKPVTWCFRCFKPLELVDTAMTIRDKEAPLWFKHTKVDFLGHLCAECEATCGEVAAGGLAEATRRYEEMNKLR